MTPVKIDTAALMRAKTEAEVLTALGIGKGFDPGPLSTARMFFIGPGKVGKSSLMGGDPRLLTFDFEDAWRKIPNVKAKARYIPTYAAFREFLEQVLKLKREGRLPFDSVAFDPIDRYQEMMIDSFGERHGGCDMHSYRGGKGGWSTIVGDMMAPLRSLYDVGLGWRVVSHLRGTSSGDGDDTERASITPGFATALVNESDYIITVNKRTSLGTYTKESGRTMNVDTVVDFQTRPDSTIAGVSPGFRVPMPHQMTFPDRPRETEWLPETAWNRIVSEYNKAVAALTPPTTAGESSAAK